MKRCQKNLGRALSPLIWTKSKRTAFFFGRPSLILKSPNCDFLTILFLSVNVLVVKEPLQYWPAFNLQPKSSIVLILLIASLIGYSTLLCGPFWSKSRSQSDRQCFLDCMLELRETTWGTIWNWHCIQSMRRAQSLPLLICLVDVNLRVLEQLLHNLFVLATNGLKNKP